MRVEEKIQITIESSKLNDIICDKCGKSILLPNSFCAGGVGTFDFGYGSVMDDTLFRVDLCDDCIKEFINSLMHKPEMKDMCPIFQRASEEKGINQKLIEP